MDKNRNRNRKRRHLEHHPSSSTPTPPVPFSTNPPLSHHSPPQTHLPNKRSRPAFASYSDAPDLHPKVKLFCEIIATTPSVSVEMALQDTGLRVTQEDVEQVLKFSYGFPGPAVKFFRWSGHQLNNNHSPYAWNLLVDLLGKNSLFDAMWDAVKSMSRERRLLSLATFASVFSSYVIADLVQEAISTFEVVDHYGVPRDVVALNSLLSAICRDGETADAMEFLRFAKEKIRPDVDTYAILLEGCEKEGNVGSARQIFADMVFEAGWDPGNVPAYDSFLSTLIKGPDGVQEAMKFFDTMKDRRCYPGLKFFKAALDECSKKDDPRGAALLWDAMVGEIGFRPDTQMYNSLIALYCRCKGTDIANRMLDEMVYNGSFPDSQTYNVLFQFLMKNRKLKEASMIYNEMIKNECVPDHANCSSAVRIYMDSGDYNMAIKVWKCMIENYNNDLEDTGNLLVVGLRDINRAPEAVKYAEDMICRRIKVNSSTLSKLKQSLAKAGKQLVYDELFRKWNSISTDCGHCRLFNSFTFTISLSTGPYKIVQIEHWHLFKLLVLWIQQYL
ncbi:pentatricopeptide repeat-containing protein At1g77360, mitochondrial-like isoform X2 [Juglans microcarpa x Juglans regia]|uniref:pentatricopeptide repeat-containing protein At1g77360, mitochondrial-like isoform X2 n=1 Tax=Juglans microcarpa x Juglans regia TaxID=2249226 RepID=UPI001B7E52E3|nr:pentatricopeptide repeat-containing protein At1g77360, mitochondrial-like isoform X2 [Juglans microcarpa x Juglans regia]